MSEGQTSTGGASSTPRNRAPKISSIHKTTPALETTATLWVRVLLWCYGALASMAESPSSDTMPERGGMERPVTRQPEPDGCAGFPG